jgi:hypothetical protein
MVVEADKDPLTQQEAAVVPEEMAQHLQTDHLVVVLEELDFLQQ